MTTSKGECTCFLKWEAFAKTNGVELMCEAQIWKLHLLLRAHFFIKVTEIVWCPRCNSYTCTSSGVFTSDCGTGEFWPVLTKKLNVYYFLLGDSWFKVPPIFLWFLTFEFVCYSPWVHLKMAGHFRRQLISYTCCGTETRNTTYLCPIP